MEFFMKKLLTKTLFILLLSSVVIPSVIQANFSTADANNFSKIGGLIAGGLVVGIITGTQLIPEKFA